MGVVRQAARRTTCWSRTAAGAQRAMVKQRGAVYRPLYAAGGNLTSFPKHRPQYGTVGVEAAKQDKQGCLQRNSNSARE